MYPKLYNSNETNFTHNGLGLLSDAITAVATEELNGMFELKIEYDSEGFLVDVIKEEMIIKAKANDKQDEQLFRIYSITKNHENDNLIIDAQHITYDLASNFVEELEAHNQTKKEVMELIKANLAYLTRFNMTSPNDTTRSSTTLYRTNPLQMVAGMEGSVLQIWGGQIERDNFNLILHDRRGSDDGVLVTYKKNLTGLNAKFDISNVITRIFPFKYIEATEDDPAQLITIEGKFIDSDLIDNYEVIRILPVDYSNDDSIETSDDLYNVSKNWFSKTGRDKPNVSMEVKFEHLWETEEYKHLAVLELVGMGDTVTVKHSKLNIKATAIVNRIEYDVLAEKNNSVDVGNVKARFTDKVNDATNIADGIDDKLRDIDDKANEAIETADGKNTIYYGPDEPTGDLKEGDIWFRVVEGEYTRTYRYDGIQWQLIIDMDTEEAKRQAEKAIDDAQDAVDRANEATEKAQEGFDKAQEAITSADSAFAKAQESFDRAEDAVTSADNAFNRANEAFDEVDALSEMVNENTGEISTIKQMAEGLQTRVQDAEGNITTLTQLADGLQTRVEDAEGNISTLQQTADSLISRIDNMQIGGRNLLRNSDFSNDLEHWETSQNNVIESDENGLKVTVQSGNSQVVPRQRISMQVSKDDNLTAQVKAKIDDHSLLEGMTFRFANTFSMHIEKVIDLGNEWKKYIFKHKADQDHDFSGVVGLFDIQDIEFVMNEIKLEKGSKATDWSPAPEDTDHKFSQIIQTIDGIQSTVADNEGNITTLTQIAEGLQARVEDAEGNITTLQQTSESFATRIENNEGNISTLTQTVDGLQTRVEDAEGNISTLTQTASSLVSRIDNLQIGGRNLVLNSEDTITIDNTYRGWDIIHEELDAYLGKEITFSFEARSLTRSTDMMRVYFRGNGTYYFDTQEVTNEWDKYSITFKVVSQMLNKPQIAFHLSSLPATGFTGEFRKLKLEKGNQATDWTPSPDDMASKEQVFSQITQVYDAINLRVEKDDIINQINISDEGILISGKKLLLDGDTTVTGQFKVSDANITSLNAGKITAGTLDAGRVNVINISANNIRTGVLTGVEIRQVSGSNQLELINGRINTYSSDGLTSTISGYGHDFFRNGSMIGRIGSANWLNDPSYRGLLFNLDTTADYMAWAFRRTSGSNPITMLSWHKSSGKDDKGFNFYDDIKIGTGYALRVRTLSTTGFTTADRLLTLENNQWDDVDGVYFRRPSGSKLFLSDTRAALINRGNAYIQVTQDSTGNRVESVSIYNRTYTSTSQQVRVTVNGVLGRSTSSRRYKLLEEPIELEYAKRILQLDAKTWYDKQSCEGYAHTLSTGEETDKEPIHRLGGLIAEDVHDAGLDLYVNYDDQNRPDGLAQNLWTLLLPIVKDHEDRLDVVEKIIKEVA